MNYREINGLRVFLIEDESMVAMLVEELLVELGCEVVDVANEFADAHAKACSLSYDVAILDVNLNGPQTFPIAEVMMGLRRPFIFATGYGAGSLPPAFSGVPVLPKPFLSRDLEQSLLAALKAANAQAAVREV